MNPQAPPPPQQVITDLEDRLAVYGKTRADRRALWAMWNSADPAWAGQWAARARLGHALQALAATGSVVLPKPGGSAWDKAVPPLPSWVAIPINRRPAGVLLDPSEEPWAPRMDWVPGWIRSSHPPQALRIAAAQINRWILATTGTPPPRVAREERSLHIFDDEKRLATLVDSALFDAERLTLDYLACDAPLGALRAARLSAKGPVLVVENKSTFDSAWRALRVADESGYAAVIFGSGDAAPTLVNDLGALEALLGVTATCLEYAGDVDIAGIEAAGLFAQAGRRAGLTVLMATALWDAVALAEPTGEDLTGTPERIPSTLRTLAELKLPDSVRTRIEQRLRVPQERIDRTALSDTSWWRPR